MDIDLDGAVGPLRVLIVSTGDVCRGPAGARLLQSELDRLTPFPVRHVVTSAGTLAPEGCDVHPLTSLAMRAQGLPATGHEARQLSEADLVAADLVLTADRSQRLRAVQLHRAVARRLFTVKELSRAVRVLELDTPPEDAGPASLKGMLDAVLSRRGLWLPQHPADDDIPDPISGGPVTHERAVAELAGQLVACAGLLARCALTTTAVPATPPG